MAEFPAIPIWTDSYLADTRHLSTEQHGAYMLLLMEAWRRPACSLPDDDSILARLSGLGDRWPENRETVMAFWDRDGRRKEWTQKRLLKERDYVASKRRSQRDNAARRWNKSKKGDATAMPKGMPNRCQNDAPTPTPTPTNIDMSETGVSNGSQAPKRTRAKNTYTPEYEALWKAYPSTEGMGKMDGFKAWQRLTPEEQAQVMASLPAYKARLAKDPTRPVKHVQGYINGRMFESFNAGNVTQLETPAQWERRLTYARNNAVWSSDEWGPMPGHAGCRVPSDLIKPGDGDDWRDKQAA